MKCPLMPFRRLSVYLLVLLLAGCPKPKGNLESGSVPARDVLFSDEIAPVGYGAYGYLVFTKRPAEMKRYLSVCQAFIRNLEPVSSYSPTISPSIMPTYWLAVKGPKFDKVLPDCKLWIDGYDYARAKVIGSAVSVLDSNGPVLVAWRQAFENVSPNEKALLLDLSGFANIDLDRAFGIWMDRITRDPKVWQAGFNLVLAREAFRNFFEKYGEQIIRATQTVKEIVG